ncbi:MAG: hypothetical protein ACAH59_02050, partial [Pseudobdellovibrionaceae bacterium]
MADPANMLYQMEDVFDQLLERNFYRPLLTEKQLKDIKDDHKKRMAKETERLVKAGFSMGVPIRSCSRMHSI